MPGTVYEITMIECEEYDGAPMLMTTWAVQEVCTRKFDESPFDL